MMNSIIQSFRSSYPLYGSDVRQARPESECVDPDRCDLYCDLRFSLPELMSARVTCPEDWRLWIVGEAGLGPSFQA